jgi:folate-binding protein YgfZ
MTSSVSSSVPDLAGAVRLSHWGLIRAAGPDAASFLHGQLTQDVTGLDMAHARLAGYCSAKGRLLASFVLWRAGPEEFLLACRADALPATLKRLSMFVLRAKCKLSDASNELAMYGLAGAAAVATLPSIAPWRRVRDGDADLIGLPAAEGVPRALCIQPAAAPAPDLPALSLDAWRWLEVRSAVPMIGAAVAEQFVPQMVNLELVGGVNFQKGCYPGQEVVARSQYRGTLKRRAFLFDVDAAAAAGQEVFVAGEPDQPAGMVADAATLRDAHSALVELKLSALDAELHLGAADGPRLHRRALPYALPADAA